MRHRRTPGVQHGSDADPGAKMLGIGSDGQCRLGACLEQQIIHDALCSVAQDPRLQPAT